MSKALTTYKQELAAIGCVLCREQSGQIVPPELHHIAEGSGLRSDWMMAPLCFDHHKGALGIHGMGAKKFLMFHGLPTEYHLLELVNKFRFNG